MRTITDIATTLDYDHTTFMNGRDSELGDEYVSAADESVRYEHGGHTLTIGTMYGYATHEISGYAYTHDYPSGESQIDYADSEGWIIAAIGDFMSN